MANTNTDLKFRSSYINKFGRYSHKEIFDSKEEAEKSAIEYTRNQQGKCNVTCDVIDSKTGVKVLNDGNHAFVYVYEYPKPYYFLQEKTQ